MASPSDNYAKPSIVLEGVCNTLSHLNKLRMRIYVLYLLFTGLVRP